MAVLHITPPPLSSQSMTDLMCDVVVLCRGQNEFSHPFWAYIGIKPSMARAFHDACENGDFNLEDYGTVMEYGEGEIVPQHVRERMERYYGADHQYSQHLLNVIESF